jgi:hypothetical protein
MDVLSEARSEYVGIRSQEGVLDCDAKTAECYALRGDATSALDLASDALARAGSAEAGAVDSMLERVRGYALGQMGRWEDARASFEASLALARARGGLEFDVVLSLDAIIRLAGITGDRAPAAFEVERAELLEQLGIASIAEIPLATTTAEAMRGGSGSRPS